MKPLGGSIWWLSTRPALSPSAVRKYNASFPPGCERGEILDAAASAELRSEHPLGKAIVAYVRAQGRPIREPERFDYTPGRGITALVDGATVLVGNAALMQDGGVAVPSSLGTTRRPPPMYSWRGTAKSSA